jgi:dGTPase
MYNFERAPYACFHEKSRGRKVEESPPFARTEFQRDRDRVLHSVAFRRLKYKTQVFVNHEGDHYRTRLTHSLEVAQVAQSLSRVLGLDQDLAELCALAHDLGHAPFGHAGEDALNSAMQEYGGFYHNDQTFRVVTELENRYAKFDGLNFSWECLEGIVKHDGPLSADKQQRYKSVLAFDNKWSLDLNSYASAEAQVAGISDDIAYNCHDLDDGFRAGFFTIEDLKQLKPLDEIIDRVEKKYPGIDEARKIFEVQRKLSNFLVADCYHTSKQNLEELNPKSVADIRNADRQIICFSEQVKIYEKELKSYLKSHMYEHYTVMRRWVKTNKIIHDLFNLLIAMPKCLPPEWADKVFEPESPEAAYVVKDYIAGMTDRYAIEEHKRIFNIYS